MNGLVWSSTGNPAEEVQGPEEDGRRTVNLRSLVFNVDAKALELALLAEAGPFRKFLGGAASVQLVEPCVVRSTSTTSASELVFYVQPISEGRSAVHSVLAAEAEASLEERLCFASELATFRREVERKAVQAEPPRKPTVIRIQQASLQAPAAVELKAPPAEFACRVVSRSQEGVDIAGFELLPVSRRLPSLTPGMHINVHTPCGSVRQYSLVNRPEESGCFVIGVKLESASRGGSRSMHEMAQVGTELTVSVPRNGFPLRAVARRPTLIAGGIGITPILSMAQALVHLRREYTAHYFVRSLEHVPFRGRLNTLGDALHIHSALDVESTVAKLSEIVQGLDPAQDEIYICGPLALIEAVSQLAAKRGFADEDIRFELFKNEDAAVDGLEFEVELARSGISFKVPAGKTVVKACAEHNVDIETSCEQGVCGTCMVPVISGDIDHHDAYLSKAERSSGRWIMPCVSRARSGRLVLDL